MPLTEDIRNQVQQYLEQSLFTSEGAVITDLDGTAVHEHEGRVAIPQAVEFGLKELYDQGRPVIINSLRFPLNVIRTFGEEWFRITQSPIPTISLNGSITGHIIHRDGALTFEEVAAFPLSNQEIDEVLRGVQGLLDDGVKDVLLFFYPRDWTRGEIIWTPVPQRVQAVQDKYRSASSVIAVKFDELREELMRGEVCMIFLLIDLPQDRLMAYQHTKRSNFFTRKGIDKMTGASEMAARLGIDLRHSVGAGDTELDKFLCCVGLAVLVGPLPLEYKGIVETIRLRNAHQLGDFFFLLADAAHRIRR